MNGRRAREIEESIDIPEAFDSLAERRRACRRVSGSVSFSGKDQTAFADEMKTSIRGDKRRPGEIVNLNLERLTCARARSSPTKRLRASVFVAFEGRERAIQGGKSGGSIGILRGRFEFQDAARIDRVLS